MADLKSRLRDLFEEFSSFAKWKYGHSHEITIYSRLMQYEQSRLEETKPPVRTFIAKNTEDIEVFQKQVSVSERTERFGQSVDVVLGREGQTLQLGEKTEKERKPRFVEIS